MDYGLKYSLAETSADDWRALYEDPARFFAAVRACGVTFAEISWTESDDSDAVLRAASLLRSAGLWASVHSYRDRALAPEAFDADAPAPILREILGTAEAVADLAGHDVPLIFHAGRALDEPHHRPLDQAMASARAFVACADAETGRSFPHVRCLIETQLPFGPHEAPRVRLGDTYADCLALVAGTGVGVCWDFGHSFLAWRRGKHGETLPEALLRRVGHVHAHDVVETDGSFEDHRLLGTGLVPWRGHFRRLAAVGFSGPILFEIGVVPFGGYGPLADWLRAVIAEIESIFAVGRPRSP